MNDRTNLNAAMATLRSALAAQTSTEPRDWFPVFKARYGMQVVFEALREVHGEGEVVTQLFTCCTAVDPILAAGLTPAYADVSGRALCVDPGHLPLSERTLALVDQHTFGIFDETVDARLASLCRSRSMLLVEDNAHSVARLGRAGGWPIADVSVHSFGIEKMLPTYFGGAIWLNPNMEDRQLRAAMVERFRALEPIDERLSRAVRAYPLQIRALNRLPQNLAHVGREKGIERGRFEPGVADAERAGKLPYEPMLPNEAIMRTAARALRGLGAIEQVRTACAEAYAAVFAELASPKVVVPAAVMELGGSLPLLRFPAFVPTAEHADAVIRAVGEMGYMAQAWYRPLLIPGALDPAAYGYDPALPNLPFTKRLSEGAVALPCDIPAAAARRIAEIVVTAAEAKDPGQL